VKPIRITGCNKKPPPMLEGVSELLSTFCPLSSCHRGLIHAYRANNPRMIVISTPAIDHEVARLV